MFKQKFAANHVANILVIVLIFASIISFCLPIPQNSGLSLLLHMFQGGSLGGLGGALADWYAVTALFRKPFGLNFPHSDLIAKNKGKVAENIARFIVREFLNEAEILALIARLDLGRKIQKKIFSSLFHAGEKNAVDTDFSRPFFKGEAEKKLLKTYLLEEVLLTPENASFIAKILKVSLLKYRERIISYVERRVKEQGGAILGWAVGNSIGRRVVGALEAELDKIDLQNPVFFENFLEKRASLLVSLKKTSQGEKNGLKGAPSVFEERYKALEGKLAQGAEMIAFDAMINDYICENIMSHLPALREKSFLFLLSVMEKWSAKEVSDRLEKAVGRDLAYIRVNGALVGFLTSALIEGGIYFAKFLSGTA